MKTVRILSIDGDGMRDLIPAYFMQQFVTDAGISNIWQSFDIITGSGFGAIEALGYAYSKTPGDIIGFFRNEAALSFRPRVDNSTKFSKMENGINNASFYDNDQLITSINNFFGINQYTQLPITMADLHTNVLVSSYSQSSELTPTPPALYNTMIPVLFSNLNLPFFQGASWKVQDVALTSASIPLYFPATQGLSETEGLNVQYVGGSLYLNNPAALAWGLATVLYPTAYRVCILSLGTGKGDIGFTADPQSDAGNPMYLLNNFIDIGNTAPSEAINIQLQLQSLYGTKIGNKDLFYYRFQPQLENFIDTEIDNTDSDFIGTDTGTQGYMYDLVQSQYTLDKQKILAFIQNANF